MSQGQWLMQSMKPSIKRRKLYDRIIECTVVEESTGCWIWQGATSGNSEKGKSGRGYGRISVHGSTSAVHRVMYVLIHGYIPAKITIDHTCVNRLCCNPDHLEAVTHKKNCKRRDKRNK